MSSNSNAIAVETAIASGVVSPIYLEETDNPKSPIAPSLTHIVEAWIELMDRGLWQRQPRYKDFIWISTAPPEYRGSDTSKQVDQVPQQAATDQGLGRSTKPGGCCRASSDRSPERSGGAPLPSLDRCQLVPHQLFLSTSGQRAPRPAEALAEVRSVDESTTVSVVDRVVRWTASLCYEQHLWEGIYAQASSPSPYSHDHVALPSARPPCTAASHAPGSDPGFSVRMRAP